MEFQALMDLLYRGDIYTDFDPSQHPDDMQGWNSTDPNFAPVLTKYRPGFIVEVGSWKGGSTAHMCQLAKEMGFTPTLMCVDTWQGGVEHRLFNANGFDSLRCKNGYPQLFYTFLANMVRHGLQGQVVPFATTSLNAAHWMVHHKLAADVIFLDGSHAYEDVFMEMSMYYDLVKPGGCLFGDDYNWDSVRAAVRTFAMVNGVQAEDRGIQWVIHKEQSKPTIKLQQLLLGSVTSQLASSPNVLRLVDGQLEQLDHQVANMRKLIGFLLQGK